jgi:hypothetical protein
MFSRRQRYSRRWEWFIKVWYIADNNRHITPANIKMEKATKSVAVTPGYLPERYYWI